MLEKFVVNAFPPASGLFQGHPEEYIPAGGFSDMVAMTCGTSGVPERIHAAETIIDNEGHAYRGVIYYTDATPTSYLITCRNAGAPNTGMQYYSAGWTSIREGTATLPMFTQFMEKMFIAGFTDTEAALGSDLQMWDGTNYRIPIITTPGPAARVGVGGGDMTPLKFYAYSYTFVDGDGFEGPPRSMGTVYLAAGEGTVNITGIDLGPGVEGIATRKLYRTEGQDTLGAALTEAPKYYLSEIADNITTVYTDTAHDDDLDHTIAEPQYNAGWSWGTPTGVIAYNGRLWAWTDKVVYWSGRPAGITDAEILSQASIQAGLYEPYYWWGEHRAYPGRDADPIMTVTGWNGTMYCFKRDSIWALDSRSLAQSIWSWYRVGSVGAIRPGAVYVAHDGIYFVSRSHGIAALWFFNGNNTYPLSDAVFDKFFDVDAVYGWLGDILAGSTAGLYAYDPEKKNWSRHSSARVQYVYEDHPAIGATADLYEVQNIGAGNYFIKRRRESSSIRSTIYGFGSNAWCETGKNVAQDAANPKKWDKLRFQISTSADTVVTVTGETEVGSTTIWTGTINSLYGEINDVNIPKKLREARWLKLKFAFVNDTWSRLDGWQLMGYRLRPRNNI